MENKSKNMDTSESTSSDLHYEVENFADLKISFDDIKVIFECNILPTLSNYKATLERTCESLSVIPSVFIRTFFENAVNTKTIRIDRTKVDFERDDIIFLKIPFSFLGLSKDILIKLDNSDNIDEEGSQNNEILRLNYILRSKVKQHDHDINLLKEEIEKLHKLTMNSTDLSYKCSQFYFNVNDFHKFLMTYFPDYKKVCDLKTSQQSFEEMNFIMTDDLKSCYFIRSIGNEDFNFKKEIYHFDQANTFYNTFWKFFLYDNNKRRLNIVKTYLSLKGYHIRDYGNNNYVVYRNGEKTILYEEIELKDYSQYLPICKSGTNTEWRMDILNFVLGSPVCYNQTCAYVGREIISYEPW